MFILGIIVNVVNDLTQLGYGHNLAVCHIVGGVSNYIGLLMEPLLSIVRVDDYVLLNKPGESKDHIDPLQVCGNKHTDSSNYMIGGISYLKGKLVLVISPQGMTGERMKCLQNGYTGPKVQFF